MGCIVHGTWIVILVGPTIEILYSNFIYSQDMRPRQNEESDLLIFFLIVLLKLANTRQVQKATFEI